MRASLSLLLCLLLAAALPAGPPRNPALLPRKVRRTWAKLLRVEDGRLPSRSVNPHLRDVDSRVRALAARSLGRLGDPGARAHLEPRLRSDADGGVRAEAALALGLIGAKESVPALVKALADVDAAAMAARALGLLEAEEAAGDLAKLAVDPGAPARLRAAALYALAMISKADGAEEGLPTRPPKDPGARAAAAYLVRRLLARGDFTPPRAWLTSDDAGVRAAMLRGLGRREGAVDFRKTYRALLPEKADALAELARDGQLALLSVLPKLESKAASRLWEALLGEEDPHVLLATLRALPAAARKDGVVRAKVRVPLRLLEKKEHLPDAVAGALVGALAAAEPRRLESRVAGFLADERWAVRAALAGALFGDGGLEEPDAAARRLWEDPDRRVRLAALEAVVKRKEDWVEPLLRQRMTSAEPPLAATAAQALVERLGEEADERLEARILQSIRRIPVRHHEERVMLVDLLAKLDAGAALERLKGDKDVLLREHVHRLLGRDVPPRRDGGLADEDLYLTNLVRYPVRSRVKVVTTRGEFEIRLGLADAPLNSWNFLALVTTGYYDGLIFHRVVPGFVAQGGDPRRDGFGGPGYMVRCERSMARYRRGTVGMALAGKDTGGSQFFITYTDTPHLEGGYTVLGQVSRGMDVVDRLLPGDGILSMELVRPEEPKGE